jgi:phage RecT family recombinase
MTPIRMARLALVATTKTPKLLECSDKSIALALMQASQLGLDPDGRNAHLVPFGTTCTLIPDYKGLVQLAYRSAQVKGVHAAAVHEKDVFEFEYGSNAHIKHIPSNEEDPGPLVYAWAICSFHGGGEHFVVLNKRQVAKRRASSRSANRSDSIWNTNPDPMWAKSAVRELSKWMPQSAGLEQFKMAMQQDTFIEAGVEPPIDVEFEPLTSDVPEPEPQTTKGEQVAKDLAAQQQPPPDPTGAAENDPQQARQEVNEAAPVATGPPAQPELFDSSATVPVPQPETEELQPDKVNEYHVLLQTKNTRDEATAVEKQAWADATLNDATRTLIPKMVNKRLNQLPE